MTDGTPASRLKRFEQFFFLTMPHYVAGVLFLIACAINIVNVVARYVFSNPIFWAEEILIFIVIWSVFLVAISVTYRGAHLCMDLIYNAFPARWQIAINVAMTVTFIACTSFTALQSWKVVSLHWRNNGVTAATDIPLVIPHSALLFGFTFMTLAVILRLRAYVFKQFD